VTAGERLLLNGNEAVARAARDLGVHLGAGYPGTPSTEILETFSALGGRAQWSPNEKVALEVAMGAAFGGGWALAAMKHVGLNVAADPLYTAAYSGVEGALVVAVADDPGLASSQNEQDSRRHAIAAGVPMLAPADAQQAYDFCRQAFAVSARWKLPVLLRLTTRVSHSKSVVRPAPPPPPPPAPRFVRRILERVMVPANARPAHRRLRQKLEAIRAWAEQPGNGTVLHAPLAGGAPARRIVADGVAAMHAREAAPDAAVLQVVVPHPAPVEAIRAFLGGGAGQVIEEGDPVLVETCRTAGIAVLDKPAIYRFGEFSVNRVRRILAGDASPEPAPLPGRPPQLCPGCPHRAVFETLKALDCIVSGDIGCYTLGYLPPFEAMDSQTCMGASIPAGLGLRHVLPPEEARRVVSVIGDSTFVHSGLTGIVEMVYNPPPGGHVVLILDNGTTAMTGLQEHPATGRRLGGEPAAALSLEGVCRAMGVPNVVVLDPVRERDGLAATLRQALADGGLWVIVTRRPCILSAARRSHQ
jgi:indolepyruvate ferredoxin oxidoreductase alpha subunit